MLLPYTALIVSVLHPFSAFSAALLLIALFGLGLRSGIRVSGPLGFLLIGLLVYLPLTPLWSLAPGISLATIGALLCLPLAWIKGLQLAQRGQLDGFLSRAVHLLLAGFVFWGLLQGPDTFTAKPQGPFNDPNTFASAIVLLIFPIVANYLSIDLKVATSWNRVIPIVLFGGGSLVYFLVASRGAFLAIIFTLPILLYAARRAPQSKRKFFVLGVILLAANFLVTEVIPANRGSENGLVGRLIETAKHGDQPRLMLFRSAWHMIEDEPWLGRGLGTYPLEYLKYREPEEKVSAGGWVHNDYLQLWLEGGLPVLLIYFGLLIYSVRHLRYLMMRNASNNLIEVGYAAGVTAVFLHAAVNFIFFFSLMSLMLGFYFARITPPPERASVIFERPPRALKITILAYAALLSYMFITVTSVDILLGRASWIQRQLISQGVIYPKYQIAYWHSVLAPSQSSPHQTMAIELLDAYRWTGSTNQAILVEAMKRMDTARTLAPCYTKYINNKLALVWEKHKNMDLSSQGMEMVYLSLLCNPSHGLSHYYAGTHAHHQGRTLEAMRWWYSGLVLSRSFQEQLLLIAATLDAAHPEWSDRLWPLIKRLELAQHTTENIPGHARDDDLQVEAELLIHALTGKKFGQLWTELRQAITTSDATPVPNTKPAPRSP